MLKLPCLQNRLISDRETCHMCPSGHLKPRVSLTGKHEYQAWLAVGFQPFVNLLDQRVGHGDRWLACNQPRRLPRTVHQYIPSCEIWRIPNFQQLFHIVIFSAIWFYNIDTKPYKTFFQHVLPSESNIKEESSIKESYFSKNVMI
jgi:hypothetical protein